MLQLNNLTRIYQKGEHKLYALNSFTETILRAEIVSVTGRSGSGKSTLLNLIGGLDKPSEGEILYMGKNLADFNSKELANYRKRQVGMIFQSFNLIPSYTALENVTLALTFGGVPRSERKKKATTLLKLVGLDGRVHHRPNELSGGEAQRVAIARAIANEPEIILADEPTGNLDSSTSEEIIELLRNLNKEHGITIIIVTHDQEIAENISNRNIRMVDGKVVEQKSFQL